MTPELKSDSEIWNDILVIRNCLIYTGITY